MHASKKANLTVASPYSSVNSSQAFSNFTRKSNNPKQSPNQGRGGSSSTSNQYSTSITVKGTKSADYFVSAFNTNSTTDQENPPSNQMARNNNNLSISEEVEDEINYETKKESNLSMYKPSKRVTIAEQVQVRLLNFIFSSNCIRTI